MKISYFPRAEVILLVLAIAGACAFLVIVKISFWFLIPAITVAYLMIMQEASIIMLDEERLKIISFNFLIGNHSIPRKSIIKINSIQALIDEGHEVYGAPYATWKRRYELDYSDSKGKKITVQFSISNRQKEKLIMENLKLVDQGF
jgi:hypothetical protein